MKSIKLQLCGLILLTACIIMPRQANAQWSLGASYEIRNEDPKNGFGVRIEREILRPIPIVDIGLRGHFSYFNDENEIQEGDIILGGDFTVYDYGLAATGGFSLGLLKPYVGLGIGNSNVEFDPDQADSRSDSKFFWNGFVGAELTPIPKLNPFIEYRFQPADEAEFAPSSDGRLIIGLSLSF